MNEHHYSRIDAGLPKSKYPAQLSPAYAKRPVKDLPEAARAAIATEVLSRYLHGELVADMAVEFETSDVTLYALLLRDHEEVWKDAQIARALARLERNQTGLDLADNPLNLARAREQIRSAQWELERLLSRLYGQKQEVTHKGNAPVLSITIVDNSGNLVDSLSTNQHTGVMSNTPELPKK